MEVRGTRRWRPALVIATAAALLGTACSDTSHGPAQAGKPTFGFDQTVKALAGSGIATLDDTTGLPLVAIASPASPVQLRAFQVRAMASEASTANGFGGDDIDHLGGGTPVPVPVSAVLGAYVLNVHTPGADFARQVMGTQDARIPATAIFPSVVLALFASDAARAVGTGDQPTATNAIGRSAGSPNRLAGFETVAFRPCNDISGFIYKTIEKVFAAVHIPPGRVGKTGSKFLDWMLQGLTNVVVAGLNFVINAAEEILVNGVKYVLAQVLDIVAKTATVAALVANMAMAVSPWNLILAPDALATTKGVLPVVASDPVTVSARLVGPQEWPAWFADCAKLAGVTLPPLKPVGAKVIWKVFQVPPGLFTEESTHPLPYEMVLHDPPGGGPAQTRLFLVLSSETPDQAKGKAHVGLVRVDVQIRRTQIEDLRKILEETAKNLANSVLQPIPAVFRDYLLNIVGVGSKQASEDLASLLDGKTSTQIAVTYHGPETPSPGPSTTAPAKGPCDLVPDQLVTQILGVPIARREPATGSFGCIKGTARSNDIAQGYFVSVGIVPDGGALAAQTIQQGGQPVAGLGDQAAFLHGGLIVSFKGSSMIVLVVKAGSPSPADDLTVAKYVLAHR